MKMKIKIEIGYGKTHRKVEGRCAEEGGHGMKWHESMAHMLQERVTTHVS